jgi:RNA polymerase sigma-70 factor (ECF subfamily)
MSNGRDLFREQLLILRCQAGDEAALAELIGRYSAGLRLFLKKISGDAAGADDLLQDVWLDVYRKLNRLKSPQAFPAWLYRIARDKAYRELRRRSVRQVFVDEKLAHETTEDEECFSPEEAQVVRAAMNQIAPEHREVLMLRFSEDMSYEQIAHVIGRPVGTVRSRIHYAKLALRAQLTFGKETSP